MCCLRSISLLFCRHFNHIFSISLIRIPLLPVIHHSAISHPTRPEPPLSFFALPEYSFNASCCRLNVHVCMSNRDDLMMTPDIEGVLSSVMQPIDGHSKP